jgi:hypothetical protein
MPKILKADGSREAIGAPKSKGFKLNEIQKIVGGYVELVMLSPRTIMLVNEEGKLMNLPVNKVATRIFRRMRRSADTIHGDVLVCATEHFK